MTFLLLFSAFVTAALGAVAALTVTEDWHRFDSRSRIVGIVFSTALFGTAAISIAAAL